MKGDTITQSHWPLPLHIGHTCPEVERQLRVESARKEVVFRPKPGKNKATV